MPIPDIVTTAELARLLGCAHDTIRNYRLACVITPVAHGKWDARQCVRAVAEHLRARGTQVTAGPVANDPGDLVMQRALLAHAQRRKLEREHAEAMAQLLDGDAARAAWAAERRHVRAALMALPDRLAPQLVDAQSLHRVRVVLVSEIDATLQALADDQATDQPEAQA
jgi:phage terminase Nu1 subunit (DNA packaging protein)